MVAVNHGGVKVHHVSVVVVITDVVIFPPAWVGSTVRSWNSKG